ARTHGLRDPPEGRPGHPLRLHLAHRKCQKVRYETAEGLAFTLLQALQVSQDGISDVDRGAHDEVMIVDRRGTVERARRRSRRAGATKEHGLGEAPRRWEQARSWRLQRGCTR